MVATSEPQVLPVNFSDPETESQRLFRTSTTLRGQHDLNFEIFGVDKETSDVLLEVNELSQRFTLNFNLNSTEFALSVLNQMSSLLQRVLSLAPLTDHGPLVSSVSECCRIAAALHVFFPLSGNYPDPKFMVNALVYKLKASLTKMIQYVGTANQLLVWLLAVGGVSAFAMPERSWYVGHLVVVTTDLDIESWEEMKRYLIKVMELAVFCEESFSLLWDEVAAKKENLRLDESAM